MRDYELTFVVRPDIDDKQTQAAAGRVEALVTQRGGQLTNVQNWGKRRLAYHIGHHAEGSYYVYRLQMEPERSAEVEHELNLDEQVLRFIMVHLDPVELEALKNPPPPMAAREPRPRREEPAEAPASAPAPAEAPAAEAGAVEAPARVEAEASPQGESPETAAEPAPAEATVPVAEEAAEPTETPGA